MSKLDERINWCVNSLENYGIMHKDKFILDLSFELRYLMDLQHNCMNKDSFDPRVDKSVDPWDKQIYEINKRRYDELLSRNELNNEL